MFLNKLLRDLHALKALKIFFASKSPILFYSILLGIITGFEALLNSFLQSLTFEMWNGF